MQKLFLVKIAYLALKLLAFKALAVGKISLVLSSVLWLKKLFSHKHQTTTHYTVVPHSHHEDTHHYDAPYDHWASGTTHYDGKGDDGYAYYAGEHDDYKKTGRNLGASQGRSLDSSSVEPSQQAAEARSIEDLQPNLDAQEMAYRAQLQEAQRRK